MPLSGPIRPPRTGHAPRQLVVLLHGWGADGANLIDLADGFARELPAAQFIAPDAPLVCEANPYGFQWFSLQDRSAARLSAGVNTAAEALNAFLDAELARLKLTPAQLALVGFSQGTMLALHVALRRSEPIACVVGFSGALLDADALPTAIRSRPLVCLIHGEMDDVVPFGALAQAETLLKRHNVPLETHTRPGLGHSIDMEGIEVAGKFLKKAFTF